jgi:hypothetical protein
MSATLCPVCAAPCAAFICTACEGALVRASDPYFKRLRALHWSEPRALRATLQGACIVAARALKSAPVKEGGEV